MDDKDKISVGLELDVSKYTRGINKAITLFSNLSSKLKEKNEIQTPKVDENLKKILELQEKSKKMWAETFNEEPVKEMNNETENIENNMEEVEEEVDKVESKVQKTNKSFGSMGGLIRRIGISIRRQIVTSIASALNPLNMFRKAFSYLTETISPRLGATIKNIGNNLTEYIANSDAFKNLIHGALKFIYYLQEIYNIFGTVFGWAKLDLFKISKKSAKEIEKSASRTTASFDELNDIGSQGDNGDNVPMGLEEVFTKDEISAMQDKLQNLRDWVNKNSDAVRNLGKILGITFGIAAVADILSNIKKVIGTSSTGLIGLQTMLGIVAAAAIITIIIKYKEDLEEFKEDMGNLRDNMNVAYKEQVKQEKDIFKVLEEQNKKREIGNKALSQSKGLHNKILGLSDQYLLNAKQVVKNSGTDLEQTQKLYNTQQLSKTEKSKYLELLIEQYNWNNHIIDELDKQGEYTGYIKDINNEYLEAIKQVSGDLNLNNESLQEIGVNSKNAKDIFSEIEELAKESFEDALNINGELKDISENEYETVLDVNSNVDERKKDLESLTEEKFESSVSVKLKTDKLKEKLNNIFDSTGYKILSIFMPGLLPLKYITKWIAKLDTGTNYVPNDQLAMIHKGEAVIPKKFNDREYFGTGNEDTNALLETLIDRVDNLELSPYITVKDIGQASVNYINNKSRITGRSVI